MVPPVFVTVLVLTTAFTLWQSYQEC
jgi:hypothetical protein